MLNSRQTFAQNLLRVFPVFRNLRPACGHPGQVCRCGARAAGGGPWEQLANVDPGTEAIIEEAIRDVEQFEANLQQPEPRLPTKAPPVIPGARAPAAAMASPLPQPAPQAASRPAELPYKAPPKLGGQGPSGPPQPTPAAAAPATAVQMAAAPPAIPLQAKAAVICESRVVQPASAAAAASPSADAPPQQAAAAAEVNPAWSQWRPTGQGPRLAPEQGGHPSITDAQVVVRAFA